MSEQENIETEVVETETGTDQGKTEKQFTQSEVNVLVANRLKREKESATKQKQEFDTLETEYKEQIGKYEQVLQNMVEAQSKDLPPSVQKLLSKLSVLDQLEFLSEEGNKVSKKTIPTTPKTSTEEKKETTKPKFPRVF